MTYALVVSFALGIALTHFFIADIFFLLFLCLLSVICVVVFKKETRIRLVFFCILAVLAGMMRGSFNSQTPHPYVLEKVGSTFSIDGVVMKEPDTRDSSTRYTVRAEILDDDGIKSEENILIVADRFPTYNYGDRVQIEGKLERPKNFTTDTDIEFDYVGYLAKDDIHFLMYRPQTSLLGEGEGSALVSNLITFKQRAIGNIQRVVKEPDSSFIAGVLFGGKQSLGEELLTEFKNVGLIHIVVLSGYNLAIIASVILSLSSRWGRRNSGFLVSVIILFLFSLMVGFTATVVRAFLMTLIALLAKHLGRPYEALRTLFVVGFVMILLNPSILLSDPSFQLSWMATFGLIVFSPLVEELLVKKFSYISLHPQIRETISSTLSVQLFLLPLLIRMSGIFSPLSFFINLVVLPFVPLVMLFGFLTSIFGFVSHFFAWPFGIVAYFFSHLILLITHISNNLPLSVLQIGSLPLLVVFMWYVGYFFLYRKVRGMTF